MPPIVCKNDCALPVRKRKGKPKKVILPNISELQEANLTDRAGTLQKAGLLWHDRPALVLILRRPGCSTFREKCRVSDSLLSAFSLSCHGYNETRVDGTFGSVMCRTEAKKLWALKDFFQENGINPVCIVHEWILPEVAAFNPSFWGGEVLLDKERAFYKALGGGIVSGHAIGHVYSCWQSLV